MWISSLKHRVRVETNVIAVPTHLFLLDKYFLTYIGVLAKLGYLQKT